jgi:hypothetical protein
MTGKLHVVCSACEQVIPPNTDVLRVDACSSDAIEKVGNDVALICAKCFTGVGKLKVILSRVEVGTPWTYEASCPLEVFRAPASAPNAG